MRASIAAVLLVGLGITLTRDRAAVESVVPTAKVASSPAEAVAASAPQTRAAPMKDGLLDSAIARRLASELPQRRLQPAPGVAIPTPAPNEVAISAPPDPTAMNRVAAAKASIRAGLDSSGAPADRARVGFSTAQAATQDRLAKAATAAEGAGALALAGKAGGVAIAPSPAGQCYRVESSTSQASWGPVPLPLLIAFDTAGTTARILTPTGGETEARASWARTGPDSLVLRLRRIGYNGSLALSAIGDAKSGVMRSSQLTSQLDQVVVTGVASSDSARRTARADAPRPLQAPAAPAAPGREARAVNSAGTAISVTAHVVSCPTR
jgi:hypothetical protein